MKKQTPANPIRFRRKPLITALEPRILLDGAAVATTAEMTTDVAFQDEAVHAESADQSVHFAAPAPTGNEPGGRREIAFVDTSVEDYQSLVDGLGDNVDAILIDGSDNGLEQMVIALQGQTGIDAIHLFSHGDVGELKLGSLTLNGENLGANAELLSALGESLTEDGDLMLYGCYVGAGSEGQSFIDSVAELTQADVAASEDLTGAAEQGGDWELEAASGLIESEALAVAGFEGVLAPTVTAVADSVTYTEGGSPVLIDTGISFSGGGDYREGYIRFTVDNPTSGDNFVLQDAPDVNAVDAISVVGNDVYRGNGAGRERIGSIDAIENGLNGQPLKILLSTPLPNSGFEEGAADWTLSSEIYGDNAGEINFDGQLISYANNSDGSLTYPGTGSGTINTVASSGTFNPQAEIVDGAGVDASRALYLHSNGNIVQDDQTPQGSGYQVDGYGSIHGPYATSSVITVEDGDSISLDFRAVGSGDDYEVFGMLRAVDGSGNFISDDPNNSANVILFAERGADTSGYVRVDKAGLSAGQYRFQFVGGTYDASGGYAVGSNLYVDNIRLISSTAVTDAIASNIASQVAYNSTADDTETERNITISAMDSAGATGSDTVTLKVTQLNNAPTFSGNGTLAGVNEDTASPAGNTVGNLFDSLLDDPDTTFTPADYLAGIIISADSSNPAEGEWQYSTDGSTWYGVGTVSSDNGLLLSRDALIRFVPAENFNGQPGNLHAHAVDSSDGSITFTNGAARETYDTTQPGNAGGTSAVSVESTGLTTYIYAVNDAPVMDAPIGGTLVDTAGEDAFSDLAGSLTANDVDSGSLSYGIQGGSDNGTYVTLTGLYGTLQVTKSTGAYTFTPNSSTINGLNTIETQAFTVTVSDGDLTSTQTLEFTLEGANDNPVFVAENSSTQVSVFSQPNLNGIDANPNADNENANLASIVQWVINEGGDYSLDTGIQNFTDADFADKLAASGFFFMTDMESGDPLDTAFLPESAKGDIRNWVDAGGVIMMTGTYGGYDTNFLNTIFGWDLTTQSGASWDYNAAGAEGTPFEGGPSSLPYTDATDAIGSGTVEGFTPIYGTDANATLATIKYGSGTVIYMGYDFYSSGISGTGFTGSAPQYGADVADGAYNNSDWVREIIPRALQYSAQLSSDTQFNESDNALDGTGSFWVSDVDQPDAVTVSVSDVVAEQRDNEGAPISSSVSQPTKAELLAMLDLGDQPAIDSSTTSGEVNWTFNSNTESFDYLAAGESLVLTYEITADDGNGGSATRTLVITVNGVNDAPVAQGGTEAIAENGVFNGNASATDVDGTITGFELVSNVSSGSLTFNPDGSYSFDPGTAFDDLAEGEIRPVTFTYRAVDNTGAASEAVTVTLNVTGSNDVPVVSTGGGTAAENGSLNSSVPAAADVDGTIAGYQLVNDVASGSLTFNSNGSYTFEPGTDFEDLAAGESRQVSFTYTATDNDGGVSAPGVVTITVTGTNDVPTISAEAAAAITEVAGDSSAQDLSDTGVVSFDDIDTTDVIDITFASNGDIAWSGGTLDAALASSLVAGFTIPATTDAAAPGSVNWTYSLNAVDLDFLAAGETLTFSYTITATDSQNATATDTVSFTITGTNDAPTVTAAIADIDYTEAGDAAAQDLSTSGTLSFDDLDATDVIDITSEVTSAAVWSDGAISAELKSLLEAGLSIGGTDVAAPGSVAWSYDIADADLDFLAAGETLTLTYRVTATDSEGATAADDVTITITGTNDAPSITAAIADIDYTEAGDAAAQDLSTSGTLSFDDLDATDVIDITSEVTSAAVWSDGAISAELKSLLEAGLSIGGTDVAAPGSVAWSYDIADADLDFLAAGETLTLTYRVTATDSEGATATDDVTITITGTNDAPSITVAIADIDYTEAGDAAAQDLSTSGTLSFDDLDATDVIDITSEVTSAAVWSDGAISAELKSLLEAGLSIGGTDVAAPGSVAWSYDIADADLDFLAAGETLTLTYRVTVTDNEGATAIDDVTITITGTNDAPVVTAEDAGPFTESEDASAQALSDTGSVDFSDKDLTDDIDISFVSNGDIQWTRQDSSTVAPLPAELVTALVDGFSVGAENQPHNAQVNWDYTVAAADLDFLNAGDQITLSYTVIAEDSQGATGETVVTVTLVGTNDGPEVTARELTDDETIVQMGEDYALEVASLFSDKDSTLSREDLDFTITGLPDGVGYDPETGDISGAAREPGVFEILITATDSEGASISRTFELTVTAVVPEAPTTGGGDNTPPPAPETDTQPVENELGGLPDGLVNEGGSSNDSADSTGYMEPTDGGFDNGVEDVEQEPSEPVSEPQAGGDGEAGTTEQVILSEPGALVVESQTPDGTTTVRASVDVNVNESGQVEFSQDQQEAFSTVSLAVASIDLTADNQITIDIQDTSTNVSSQQYSGSLSSGEQLPAWIQMDPATGSVTITNPPTGQKDVSIRIQAVGTDGQVRVLELKLDLKELLKRSLPGEGEAVEAGDADTAGFVPLSDQLEAELAALDQYGDRLMALLQSA